jgi:diguanylate cyclase (GGDEF)-like protein
VLFVLRHDPWIAENATRTLIGASTNIPLGLLLGANRSLVQRLRAAHTKIKRQSTLDDLSGCCNRRHAFSSLASRMEESVRHHYPLSIAYIDLDNLKTVNDTQGHARGDELICAFAESAADAVRKTDTVCRIGGDEFLLILPYCTEACARRVIGRIETTFVRRWSPLDEAVFSHDLASASSTDTLDSLIERADTRMYEQKRLRKAGDVISPSDDEACKPLSRESREGGRT